MRNRKARTKLGEKLLALRKKAMLKGMPLLGWDDVSKEVQRRRGKGTQHLFNKGSRPNKEKLCEGVGRGTTPHRI